MSWAVYLARIGGGGGGQKYTQHVSRGEETTQGVVLDGSIILKFIFKICSAKA
jgi:hypothetical protein